MPESKFPVVATYVEVRAPILTLGDLREVVASLDESPSASTITVPALFGGWQPLTGLRVGVPIKPKGDPE